MGELLLVVSPKLDSQVIFIGIRIEPSYAVDAGVGEVLVAYFWAQSEESQLYCTCILISYLKKIFVVKIWNNDEIDGSFWWCLNMSKMKNYVMIILP